MSKTYCTNCNDQLTEEEIRWANDEQYCEDCFNDRFVYCERCDSVIRRNDAHFNNDDVPFCDDCWESDYDEECPDNPEVDDSDRSLIIELSRDWLLGKTTKRSVIKINQKDFMLSRIKEKVGLVDSPIYIFGLIDREEYQLSVSANLLDAVKEYIVLNGLNWKVTEGIGCSRLGISHSLRKDNLSDVLKLIKSITNVRETVLA